MFKVESELQYRYGLTEWSWCHKKEMRRLICKKQASDFGFNLKVEVGTLSPQPQTVSIDFWVPADPRPPLPPPVRVLGWCSDPMTQGPPAEK